jgi:crotonobetainyl-CoA:carnitine CoA-transferase CaiB-like acyl-CoA transferase
MTTRPLDGIVVLEFGCRLASGATGSFLAQLGASVFFIEADGKPDAAFEDKFSQRDVFAYGKKSLRWDGNAGDKALRQLVEAADVIIKSSDADLRSLPVTPSPAAIVCDITAFGAGVTGGQPVSDILLQAMSGIIDTTGDSSGPPVAIGAPVVELSTALYAAASIVAALRVRRASGMAQAIDMSLYDCAVNAMATFFPSHFGGGKPRRLGNRHSMAAPWNAYRASDGWVLMCSASEAHWQKICEVIGQPALGRDARFASLADRMARRDEVDAHVGAWMQSHPVRECIAALGAANIACGEIVPVGALADEPNLRHRRITQDVVAPNGKRLRIVGNLFEPGKAAYGTGAIPVVDNGRAALPAKATAVGKKCDPHLPLKGIRVVELGQYTTAPLAGRHLATLGAEVIKVEPMEGDSARQWAPHRDGMSYFFVMSNSGKRAVGVDLRSDSGLAFFRDLLDSADVLVENMKPGSLARLGFSAEVLAELNPRLVYTSITGFGADSAYPERPAFDTVVQAMCGLMDVTRFDNMPLKAGISIADISGGQIGLLAILAGLELRDRNGRAPRYDLSMQDVAAWLTQLSWNGPRPAAGSVVADGDGFAAVDTAGGRERVKSVAEVADAPRTKARNLIVMSNDAAPWPLLGSPLGLTATPPQVDRAIGRPEPLSPALERELGLEKPSASRAARR